MNRIFRKSLSSLVVLATPQGLFLVIIFGALAAFEMFNYSTTEHALMDILGSMEFASIRWSTLLAIAFCGIDFAGIARLFTPEQGAAEPKEVWYLFVAWLIGATANAILTWWGVMMALSNHPLQSTVVMDADILLKVVPVFVAVLVWVVRILIVGTLATALDRIIHAGGGGQGFRPSGSGASQPLIASIRPVGVNTLQASGLNRRSENLARPAVQAERSAVEQRVPLQEPGLRGGQEPSYHSLSASPRGERPVEGRGPRRT